MADTAPSLAPPRAFTLRYEARPPTVNAFRNLHHYRKAALTAEWRFAFATLAREARIPPLGAIRVVVDHELRNRRSMPDTGACMTAVKAAIDGLVDAGVILNDGPAEVLLLSFRAPVVTGVDALVLTIIEEVAG